MRNVTILFEPHPEQPGRIDFMPLPAQDFTGCILHSGGAYRVQFRDSFVGFFQIHTLLPLENGQVFPGIPEAQDFIRSIYNQLLQSIIQ